MTRTPGARDRNYAAKRHELARSVSSHLVGQTGRMATFVELANAAEVSPTTLKHYFGDREGAYAAALKTVAEDSAAYLTEQVEAAAAQPDASDAIRHFLQDTVIAWRSHGLASVFTGTMTWGLTAPDRGPLFLAHILDPLLDAAARLLHLLASRAQPTAQRAGDHVDEASLRLHAIEMMSPMILALLHQDVLGGRDTRPMDVEELIEQVATGIASRLQPSRPPFRQRPDSPHR